MTELQWIVHHLDAHVQAYADLEERSDKNKHSGCACLLLTCILSRCPNHPLHRHLLPPPAAVVAPPPAAPAEPADVVAAATVAVSVARYSLQQSLVAWQVIPVAAAPVDAAESAAAAARVSNAARVYPVAVL